MVPLRDILNEDQYPEAKPQAESPETTVGSLVESPKSHAKSTPAQSHLQLHEHCQHSSNHCHTHTNEGDGNLPSPPFSMSPCGSCRGNSDNDNDSEEDSTSNLSKCDSGECASHMNTPQSESTSSNEEEVLVCQWDNCGKTFSQPELLYHHLCSEHVGRKSQKNLQLNCKWKGCHAKTEKRDHITSHLRVHVPLKPFKCSTCSKKFKRPQDLKKHLKIHVESHMIVRKKRGPVAGSRRVSKKRDFSNESPFLMNAGMRSASATMNLDSKRQSIGSDTSIPSPIGNSAFPSVQQNLPPISMQQLISSELSSYEPIYTKQLGSRLQTILPPLASDDHLPRTSPMATTNAARFFSTLSKNMTNSIATAQHAYAQQPQQSISQQVPEVPLGHFLQSSITNNVGTNSTNMVGTPQFTRNTYPEIRHLPPIASTHTSLDNSSRLPSLSSVPVLTPRYGTFDRVPQFNSHEQYFSSIQRSTGSNSSASEGADQDLLEKLSSLRLGEQESNHNENVNDDFEEFVDVLGKVNIMRDYLLCVLLEEEYDTDVESTPSKEQPRSSRATYPQDRPVIKLSKYPQLIV